MVDGLHCDVCSSWRVSGQPAADVRRPHHLQAGPELENGCFLWNAWRCLHMEKRWHIKKEDRMFQRRRTSFLPPAHEVSAWKRQAGERQLILVCEDHHQWSAAAVSWWRHCLFKEVIWRGQQGSAGVSGGQASCYMCSMGSNWIQDLFLVLEKKNLHFIFTF